MLSNRPKDLVEGSVNNNMNTGILEKAELLMELRGYKLEDLHHGEEAIDIKASKQDQNQSVLIHIVTKSELELDGVSIEKAREVEQILEEEGVDKIIVFGNRFTDSARRELRKQGIEFFSKKHKIVSSLNPQELYLKTREFVDTLCQIKCGYIPESEDECNGFSESPFECTYCNGSGIVKSTYREYKCPICGGIGSGKSHYSCIVRLVSDNADFHFEHNWINLLQHDLLSLLKILQASRPESEKHFSLPLTHTASITTEASKNEK